MSNKKTNQDPIFKGNFEDFNTYLGGYVRNSVQDITRKYKKIIGSCEYGDCHNDPKNPLEAAHKTSRDDIIELAFKNSEINKNETTDDIKENKIRSVDLNIFNILNKIYHTDPEEFHFLCKDCHKKLDDKKKNKDIEFDETKIKRTKNISKIAVETYINMLLEILYVEWHSKDEKDKINYLKNSNIIDKEQIENLNKYFEKKNKFSASDKLNNLINAIIIIKHLPKKHIIELLKTLYEEWNSQKDKDKIDYLKNNKYIDIEKEEKLITDLNKYFESQSKKKNKFNKSNELDKLKNAIIIKHLSEKHINELLKTLYEEWNSKKDKDKIDYLKNNINIDIEKEEKLITDLNEFFERLENNNEEFNKSKIHNDLKETIITQKNKSAKKQYVKLIEKLYEYICKKLTEEKYKEIKETLKNKLLDHYIKKVNHVSI